MAARRRAALAAFCLLSALGSRAIAQPDTRAQAECTPLRAKHCGYGLRDCNPYLRALIKEIVGDVDDATREVVLTIHPLARRTAFASEGH